MRRTEVSAFIGGLGRGQHLVEVPLELLVPLHELIDKDGPQSHPQDVFPRIYSRKRPISPAMIKRKKIPIDKRRRTRVGGEEEEDDVRRT